MSNTDWKDIMIQIKIKKVKEGLKNDVIAAAVGLSSNHVSSVINGYINSVPARVKICDYLGIKYEAPQTTDTKM